MRTLIPLAAALFAAMPAVADTALLIANTRYDAAQGLRHADEIAALEGPLTAAGFEVIVVENGPAEAMRAAVSALLDAAETERVLIAVAGHVVRSQRGTWILGTDAETPDLATVGAQGVSLDVLLEIAGRAPGRALVLVGQEPRRIDLGAGLDRGFGPIEAPQGVAMLSGAPDDLVDFARREALRPGADLAEAVAASRDLRSHGFLSSALPFLDSDGTLPAAPAGPAPEEIALWAAVQELNTIGAYRAYLEQYPQGTQAEEARRRIAAFEAQSADPLAAAEAAEEALALSRSARQQIQRDLSILEHDPRGIDGIFGNGTRAAIRSWQAAAGYEVTGFITAPQVSALRSAAAQRAAELEEEARIRQEEQARADRAFWQAIGQGQDEAGLRAYLERYPNGLFSDVAQSRLDAIEAARRAEAEAAERAAWDAVRQLDTVEAYQRYLRDYPQGLFVEMARARISALELGLNPQELAQAEAREAALNLAEPMRRLVEQRLAALGLDPGPLDGVFDTRTRRAIRGYQGARGLPATGYLDQLTMVRLLAEAIGGSIFR